MRLRSLQADWPPELTRPVEDFERGFIYPPDPRTGNRIVHGAQTLAQLRALGPASSFIAEEESGRVDGLLGVAIRQLRTPDGEAVPVLQVVDYRLRPGGDAEAGKRLAQAAHLWGYSKVHAAFALVPEDDSPEAPVYADRASIPAFRPLAKVAVFKFPCPATGEPDDTWRAPAAEVERAFVDSVLGRYALPAGDAAARSRMEPVGLVAPDRAACGLVEDVRRHRRVLRADGRERPWAHLSNFTFREGPAALELISRALQHAAKAGCTSLCVAVPEPDAKRLRPEVARMKVTEIPVRVFGTLLDLSPAWHVSSAEI